MVPRIALRLTTRVPAGLAGNIVEKVAANASHAAFYALMTFMPASGIAMGYYGGKGLPFFGYTIPGALPPAGCAGSFCASTCVTQAAHPLAKFVHCAADACARAHARVSRLGCSIFGPAVRCGRGETTCEWSPQHTMRGVATTRRCRQGKPVRRDRQVVLPEP